MFDKWYSSELKKAAVSLSAMQKELLDKLDDEDVNETTDEVLVASSSAIIESPLPMITIDINVDNFRSSTYII